MIALPGIPRCTAEEWEEFRKMVAHGMLFEVVDWIDQGKPTLRPENKHSSTFESAVLAPNLSMTKILWERAWQERKEAVSAMSALAIRRTSAVVMRYLLEQNCPVDHVTGYDLCMFHDMELVRLGIASGVSLLEPDGWASAFTHTGSRPLIRMYLDLRETIPGLKKDAMVALCKCIEESRLRATALLRWAGVDPLGKGPRYYEYDDEEDEWDGFPALHVARAEKAVELLKLLKLKPTIEQWFDLLKQAGCGRAEVIPAIMALQRDPDAIFRENADHAKALLRSLMSSMCWLWRFDTTRDQQVVDLCIRLLDHGVPLCWENDDDLMGFRRTIYRSSDVRLVFKVLSRAAETARDRSRAQMIELVRTPKMRELAIKNDPMILRHLGIPGPADPRPSARSSRRIPQRTSGETPLQRHTGCVAGDLPTQGFRKRKVQRPKPHAGHLVKRAGGRVLDREQIYKDVWKEAAMHVAKRYGISGSMLARICTRLNIPRPPVGYWARPAKARKGKKPQLPPWTRDEPAFWAINPVNVRAQKRSQ